MKCIGCGKELICLGELNENFQPLLNELIYCYQSGHQALKTDMTLIIKNGELKQYYLSTFDSLVLSDFYRKILFRKLDKIYDIKNGEYFIQENKVWVHKGE